MGTLKSGWCLVGDHAHCQGRYCDCDVDGCTCRATKEKYPGPESKTPPLAMPEKKDEPDE